ncbi:MAG: hypothetical protein DBX49_08210, partial [Clostridia bacterium]
SDILKDIVVFDRLEQAPSYRSEKEELTFDNDWWYGTFAGVVTEGLTKMGIAPVVYYNSNRDAKVPGMDTTGSTETAEEVLNDTANGWIRANAWNRPLSEVRAVAVDMSKKTDGSDFQIEDMGSVAFQIKMTAPAQVQELLGLEEYCTNSGRPATYAYNNAAFYSVKQFRNGGTDVQGTETGNSTYVRMCSPDTYELTKELAENVPQGRRQEQFLFTVKQDGKPYASREYTLWRRQPDGAYIKEEGSVHATDGNGGLLLSAGEKAVFAGVADASLMSAQEEENLFWEAEYGRVETTTEDGQTVLTETVTNSYHPVLYVTKKAESVPADMDVSGEGFTMLLEADGEPVRDRKFWYVKQARTDGGIPEIDTGKGDGGCGVTSADGTFTLCPGEVIALPLDNSGVNFTVEEIAGANGENDDWICRTPKVSGTLPEDGKLVTITNIYRWKSLYVTKLITHQDAKECEEEFTFKLELKDEEGKPYPSSVLEGITWTLLGNSQGAETGTDTGEDTGLNAGADAGTPQKLGDDGCFTAACAGKTIRIDHLPAGAAFTLTETEYNEELYLPENGGVVENTMPVYSLQRSVRITNDYLLRPLTVSKLLVYEKTNIEAEEDAETREFTFTVEIADGETAAGGGIDTEASYRPLADAPYRLYKNGMEVQPENGQEFKTDENGTLKLKHAETAVFENAAKEGTPYRITETEDEEYGQLFPASGKPAEGLTGAEGSEIRFVNGSGNGLVIRKEYTADVNDAAAQAYLEELKKNPEKGSVTFRMQVKDEDGKYQEWPVEKDVQVILIDQLKGTMEECWWWAGEKLTVSPWIDVYILEGLPADSSYRLTESASDQHRIFEYVYQDEGGEQKKTWLSVGQVQPEEDGAVSGTVAVQKEASIINQIASIPEGSEIVKQMAYGSDTVPEGSLLVWQVQRHNGTAWEAAKGIPDYVRDDDGAVDDRIRETGKDGKIHLEKTDNGYPAVSFPGSTVKVNLQAGAKGDLRVVEVPEESDAAWGYLAGYASDKYSYITNAFDYDVSPEDAIGFVNANKGVEAEIAKVMDEPCDETFTMVLERVLSTKKPFSSPENVTAENITASEAAKGIAYTVYDASGKHELRQGRTTPKGEIFLKAGEVARLTLPEATYWTVREVLGGTYGLQKLEAKGNCTELGGNLALIGAKAEPIKIVEKYTLSKGDVKGGVTDALTGQRVVLNDGDVKVPELISKYGKLYRVTAIGEYAFGWCENLTSVVLPESVENIGEGAFYACDNLGSVNFPKGLKSIGEGAFWSCSLRSVELPEGLECINKSVFRNCKSLTEVVIPESVTEIGDYAFYDCRNLTRLNLPEGLKRIGEDAFYYCAISEVKIPEGVTDIGSAAFANCKSLKSVVIPEGVTTLSGAIFIGCSGLTSVVLPKGLKSIEIRAFAECSSLTSVVLPEELENIGEYAFYYCTGLKTMKIPGSVTAIGSKAFHGCRNLTSVEIGEGLESIGEEAFLYCNSLKTITIDRKKGIITGSPWGAPGSVNIVWTGDH